MVKMIISKEGNILEHMSASFHHFLILLLEKMFLQKHSERNLRRYWMQQKNIIHQNKSAA